MLVDRRCLYLSAVVGLAAVGPPRGTIVRSHDAARDDAPVTTWVTFEDPTEHAFTVEVPKGWTVRGGLYRLGYSDHRQMIDITSPDGKTNVRIGDVAIPIYFLPDNNHRPGDIYDLGAQARATVATYKGGQAFAALYGPARFKAVCTSLAPRHADALVAVPRYALDPSEVRPTQSSVGQATYDCALAAGSRVAYAYSETMLFGAFWLIPRLVSFVAPPDQVALAESIMLHAVETFRQEQTWLAQQTQYDMDAVVYQRQRQQGRMVMLQHQVAQFEANMQGMQSQVNSFERGQAKQAAQVSSMGNTLTGITPTIDPEGNPINVNTGPRANYWINGATGKTANSTQSPGAGWQQLTPQ
jgi:hypothetical protein